jgi:hypothetical protein
MRKKQRYNNIPVQRIYFGMRLCIAIQRLMGYYFMAFVRLVFIAVQLARVASLSVIKFVSLIRLDRLRWLDIERVNGVILNKYLR